MGQMGLPVPSVAASSTDQMVQQFWSLLNQAGLDLVDDPYPWQFLLKTHTITTTGATVYPLPDDFAGFHNNSAWNNTQRLPVAGSLTPQIWRMLKARNFANNTFILQYIIKGDQIELYTAPSVAQTLEIDYQSRGWVRDATNPLVFRDFLSQDSDFVLYDPSMMTSKLKLAWRSAKGFDTTAVQNEYDDAYERAKGADTTGMTLSLAPTAGFPYLGYWNIPDTGYGQ